MSDIQVFSHDQFGQLRIFEDDHGELWFIAKDVCNTLGLTNVSVSMSRLDDDERSKLSLGRQGETNIINEYGLYSLVLASRKPEAKTFKRWVTHEVLPAIRKHGGYIRPDATVHQVNAIIAQARARMELCQAARGIVDPAHLEAKARVILAQGMGEHAQLDPGNTPLYTSDFLKSKNLSQKQTKKISGTFGKRVKAAYILEHGIEPGTYPMNLPNGQVRPVLAYTEKDRPIMERVWKDHYEPKAA